MGRRNPRGTAPDLLAVVKAADALHIARSNDEVEKVPGWQTRNVIDCLNELGDCVEAWRAAGGREQLDTLSPRRVRVVDGVVEIMMHPQIGEVYVIRGEGLPSEPGTPVKVLVEEVDDG
jgi:hypothetical protein